MQFVDYQKIVQDRLDVITSGLFEVATERNVAANGEKVNVVLKQLVGTPMSNSAVIPYQMDIYTDKPQEMMNIFTAYARNFSNKQFNSTVNEGTEEDPDYKTYVVVEFVNTPVVMEEIIEAFGNKMARIVVYVSLTILKEVSNIASLKIDGEEIEFTNASLSYAAQIRSNRISGQQLNKGKKQEATTKIIFSGVNKNSIFYNKLFRIMFGLLDGNTSFSVEVTLTNGLNATVNMICDADAMAFTGKGQPQLPSNQVSLTLYDDRVSNNGD